MNRKSKDSCEKARVLLLLLDGHAVHSGAATARCKLGRPRGNPPPPRPHAH